MAECVLFDPTWRVLLITRGKEPFRGGYALLAGFVESWRDCGRSLPSGGQRGDRGRDLQSTPQIHRDLSRSRAAIRGHAVSVAYAVRLPRYMLAFNGAEIVADAEAAMAVARRKTKVKASAG